MMRTVTFSAIAATCSALFGFSAVTEDGGGFGALPYVTLTGSDSQIKDRCYYRITSETEWSKLWQRHRGQKENSVVFSPDTPSIDFEKCMVIAVFLGNESGNLGLKPLGLAKERGQVVLKFEDKYYQTMSRGYNRTDGDSRNDREDGRERQRVAVFGFFVIPKSNEPIVLEEYLMNINDRTLTLVRRFRIP